MVKWFQIVRLRPGKGGLRGFIIVATTYIIRPRKSPWRDFTVVVMIVALAGLWACQEEPPPRPAVKNRVRGIVKPEEWRASSGLPEEWRDLFQISPNRDLLFTLRPLPGSGPADAPADNPNQESLVTIQVGSFRGKNPGHAELQRLHKKGLDVFMQTNTIDSVTWHRICLGYFRDESLAKETALQLVRDRRIKSYRIIRVRKDDQPG
jgi:hypothetical protein